MLGSSRTSLRLLDEAVTAAYHDPELARAGSDLLAVGDLLGREKSLRRELGDSGRRASHRTALLAGLIGGKVSPLALSLASDAVGQRWSSDSDMVDGIEYAGAAALIAAAEQEGRADRIADELFRFSRIVDASGDLQLTLTSTSVAGPLKRAIVEDLLTGKADPVTVELAGFAVTHLRGRRIDDALMALVDLAAVRRGSISAVVRVAAALEPDQLERIAAALRQLYGQNLQLSIEVDPTVVGGASVQVGDEVIDGTIAHRIEQARRRLAG